MNSSKSDSSQSDSSQSELSQSDSSQSDSSHSQSQSQSQSQLFQSELQPIQKKYSIYSLLKNNKLIEQATIQETSANFNLILHQLDPSISHMNKYIEELFNLMIKYERAYPYSHKIYKTKN